MTIHAIIEYLKYRWIAKGRHGTHSPYVYDFVETILQDRGNMTINEPLNSAELPEAYNILVDRIMKHYGYKTMLSLPDDAAVDTINKSDMILFPAEEPLLWENLAKKYFPLLKDNTVVLVGNIHDTGMHTHEWNTIRSNKQAMMSIDLYGVGLLIFRKEFKEKQHFVLKYKA